MKRMMILVLSLAGILPAATAQINGYNTGAGTNTYLLNPYAKYDNKLIDNSIYKNNSLQYNRGNNENTATFPGNGTYYDRSKDYDFNNLNHGGNTVDMNTHIPSNGSNSSGYENMNGMRNVNSVYNTSDIHNSSGKP